MHVLVIPYDYPTDSYPSKAIFIREQVSALRRQISMVGVLAAIPKTISMCIASKNFTFGMVCDESWVVEVPAIRGFAAINRLFSCWISRVLFKKYIQAHGKPDIVHVHNADAADLAVWINKTYKIPFVITEHSSKMWQLGRKSSKEAEKLKRVYEQSTANFAVSQALADHLSAVFNFPFIYIPNVVDTDFFQLNTSRLSNENIRIASIGNLTENKNHLALIKAVGSLVGSGYPIHLVIAGSGEQKETLVNYISNHGLQNKVKLLGSLSKSQVRALLMQSDFFVLPSIKETFGVVLIEAMASGLPVLAYKSGGPESIITSDAVGMLLSSKDDLANGLIKLMTICYDSPVIRKYVIHNFSYEAVSLLLLQQYSAILK
jgi:glycosyltransferase involved in cell wall biosynthesis